MKKLFLLEDIVNMVEDTFNFIIDTGDKMGNEMLTIKEVYNMLDNSLNVAKYNNVVNNLKTSLNVIEYTWNIIAEYLSKNDIVLDKESRDFYIRHYVDVSLIRGIIEELNQELEDIDINIKTNLATIVYLRDIVVDSGYMFRAYILRSPSSPVRQEPLKSEEDLKMGYETNPKKQVNNYNIVIK